MWVSSWPNGTNDQAKKGDLPQKVYVTLEGSSEQEAVPIEPVTAKFYGKQGVTLQRTQLPLLPCWAATIRKVQGLSLDAAVIDVGPKMFEDGMAYVALSRVRTIQGVALLGLVEKKITSSTVANDEMDRLRNHRLKIMLCLLG